MVGGRLLPEDIRSWNEDQVGVWISSLRWRLGVSSEVYKKALTRNNIGGEELLALNEELLMKCGVRRMDHVQFLLKKIERLSTGADGDAQSQGPLSAFFARGGYGSPWGAGQESARHSWSVVDTVSAFWPLLDPPEGEVLHHSDGPPAPHPTYEMLEVHESDGKHVSPDQRSKELPAGAVSKKDLNRKYATIGILSCVMLGLLVVVAMTSVTALNVLNKHKDKLGRLDSARIEKAQQNQFPGKVYKLIYEDDDNITDLTPRNCSDYCWADQRCSSWHFVLCKDVNEPLAISDSIPTCALITTDDAIENTDRQCVVQASFADVRDVDGTHELVDHGGTFDEQGGEDDAAAATAPVPTAAPDTPTGTVVLSVLDVTSGSAVTEGSVDLENGPSPQPRIFTNVSGSTPLVTLPLGRYNVMVRKSGYIADRVPIALNTPLLRRTVGLSPKLAPKQYRVVLSYYQLDVPVLLVVRSPSMCNCSAKFASCGLPPMLIRFESEGYSTDALQSISINNPSGGDYRIAVMPVMADASWTCKLGSRVAIYMTNSDRHYFTCSEESSVTNGVWDVAKIAQTDSAVNVYTWQAPTAAQSG